MVVKFGQVVLGPPGSGKTTYCKAMANYLKDVGRKTRIVNLDPGNDELPYTTCIDIRNLTTVENTMKSEKIGPNGALVHCFEYLEKNTDWLITQTKTAENDYFIFDFPGQVELYTHHKMVSNILKRLEKEDFRLCAVFLVDSHYANDTGKYVSAVLLTLNSMLNMEIATVNIFSKVDTVESFGKLRFGLDFYTEVLDLEYLLEDEEEKSPFMKKYHKLNRYLADIVKDYSLVSYIPLDVENRSTIMNVIKAVDKANGYVFGVEEERNIQKLLSCAVGAEYDHEKFGAARDLYTDSAEKEDSEFNEKLLELIATQNVGR